MKRLLLLVLLLLPVFSIAAQEDTPPEDIPPALFDELRRLDSQTSTLRELETLTDVAKRFPTRAEVLDFVETQLDDQLDAQTVFEETLFYRAFGFVDADFDLLTTYTNLLGDQVAGYYDPETDEMNVLLISGGELGDTLPALEATTYVHEYVHALQDQHFDLSTFLEVGSDLSADEILARQSLVEGDATASMQDYLFVLVQERPEAIAEILMNDIESAQMPEGTPRILEAELLTPYLAGMDFVTALRNQGGWEAVNAAFENPPISMEQIYHPDKYLSGEAPIVVSVADAELDEAWELLYERTLGEFYLREFLKTQIGGNEGNRAAAGWGGDRYKLYYNAGADQLAWVLRVAWDDEAEQAEFTEALATYAGERIGGEQDADNCWSDPEQALCVSTSGTDVVISFAPDTTIAVAMLAAQMLAVSS